MLKKEKNSYAVFFPPQKLTSIFFSQTHMSSPFWCAAHDPEAKIHFFSERENCPPKKFIMKTRLNSLPSEFGSSSDDTGRKLIKSTTIISFNTLSAIFEAAFFQSARAHHCYAADVSVFEKFK